MSKTTQTIATVFLGLAVLIGSFAVASNDFAYGSQSMLAATVSLFQAKPLVSISRNTNSPSGSIIPGRSQVLAVFDVKGEGLTRAGHITVLPVFISTFNNGSILNIGNVSLTYRYCVPKGNIYAYGYKYGYSGVYCRSMNAYPTASVKTGEGYKLSFSNIDLPVYPDQTSSSLYLSGTAYYKITDKSSDTKKIGKLQAKITNGVIAQTEVCTTVNYGVGGKKRGYGYPTCRWTSLSTNLWLAYGNILEVARAYGYNTTGPIIDVFPPNPQPAPANPQPEGGTQTGTTGTTGSGTGTTGAGATQTTGTGGSTPAPIIQTTPTTPVPQESAKPTGGGRAEFQMDAQ